MTRDILFTQENHIGLVTLNRPQALNALNLPMILALQEQLQIWQDDDQVHAVVIRSTSERAFCAGGDVRAIYHHGHENYQQKMDFFGHEYRFNQFIHDFNKPYIALMDGITMGGGVGISLHGSHPIASERFLFAMPETGIGFYPDVGASYLLSRCPGHFGLFLGLTGDRLGAADAQAVGLVNYIIASSQFPDVLRSLMAGDLSLNAHQRVDDILRKFIMPTPLMSLDEFAPFVDDCFQHTDMESILTALNQSEHDWHQEIRHILSLKAPLSLKVTLKQLHKAKSMTLAECLAMDYCLTSHFMRDPDFNEGVRALLMDKDNQPHWQPKTLAEVNDTLVISYFE